MEKKNELLLQGIFIFITGLLISLIIARFYPDSYFKHKKAIASEENRKIVKKLLSSPKIADKEIPTQISVPSVSIDVTVAPGVITGNEWTLYDDKVTWLSTSDTPNTGNTIIYGHNRLNLFGNLEHASVNDEIYVNTNKNKYLYKITEIKKVKPQDTYELISEKNELTLYTCDGYFDEWRILIKADFKKAV